MQLHASAAALSSAVYVIHVLIDDLGYNDYGFQNNQSITPTIDSLHRGGVEIPEFYVFKSCAPSRASLLSGRYPWHVGYSKGNGNQNEAIPLDFDLLPAYLKRTQPNRWDTHAVGKWHVGWAYRNCTPAGRGFDTFLGTSGNLRDHWDHTTEDAETWFCKPDKPVFALIDAKADDGSGAGVVMKPATWAKGTYSAHVFTNHTVNIVKNHPRNKNLYVYLAYHNVHNPLQAPLQTVERHSLVSSDVRRVYEAMLTEVDDGIQRIMSALEARSMLSRSVFIIHSDNGGAKYASNNWPLRGQKFTYWEGGLRARAIVSNPGGTLIPSEMRGSVLQGMGHLSDWYLTIAHGIGGARVDAQMSSGPIPPDSMDLWPWITGQVFASPRTTVVHSPLSEGNGAKCTEPRGSGHGCAASIREDDWKLIIGDPGDDALYKMPPPSSASRRFLIGTRERCYQREDSGHAWCKDSWNTPRPMRQSSSCLPNVDGPCLFNIRSDPSENSNVAEKHPFIVRRLTLLLKRAARTEPEPDFAASIVEWGPGKAVNSRRLRSLMCDHMKSHGADLPADWPGLN